MERAQKLRTLVIDQDEQLTKLIVERLALHGVEVSVQKNPDNVLPILEGSPFQLVFLSDQITGSESLDIAGKIRTELSSKPEIIVLTNNPKISIFDVHQAGAAHYLRKPLNFDDLVDVVERFGRPLVSRDDRVSVNPQILGKMYGMALTPKKGAISIEVKNIGRGGFFIEIPVGQKAPAVGEILEFELKLGMVPNYSFKGKGIVRWSRSTVLESGVGVEFLEIPTDSENLIHAFVELFKIKSYLPSEL